MNDSTVPAPTLLKPAEVAAMLHITRSGLNYWARKGEIDYVETPGGHRRYELADVRAFIERRTT